MAIIHHARTPNAAWPPALKENRLTCTQLEGKKRVVEENAQPRGNKPVGLLLSGPILGTIFDKRPCQTQALGSLTQTRPRILVDSLEDLRVLSKKRTRHPLPRGDDAAREKS